MMQLGIRQRAMLRHMVWYGHGGYPEQWVFRFDEQRIMKTLYRKGLVTSPTRFAALTTLGEEIQDWDDWGDCD